MGKIKKKRVEGLGSNRGAILQIKVNKETWIILGAGILVSLLYLSAMLFYTEGHLSLPASKVFYQFQYAKQIAAGEFFRYASGDGPSTGAGGLLYPLLLMPAFVLGIKGAGIILYAFFSGVVLLLLSAWLLFLIGQSVANKETGMFAALLFLLNGTILWTYLGGTETLLFATLILLTIYYFLRAININNYIGVIIFASSLALVRFEGIILVWILTIVFFINMIIFKQMEFSRGVLVIIPAIIGGFHLFMNFLFTGNLLPNTIHSESILFQANTPLPEIIGQACKYYFFLIKDIFSGFSGEYFNINNPDQGQVSAYFPPFALFFGLMGLALAAREVIARHLGGIFLIVLWFFGGILLSSILYPIHSLWNISVIPYYPIFIILVALGTHQFSQAIASLLPKTPVGGAISYKEIFYGFCCFFLLFSLCSTISFSVIYGKSCYNTYYHEITLGKMIQEKFPPDAVIATNGMSPLAYFGERRFIDISGIGSNGLAASFRHGQGSIFEALESRDVYPQFFVLPENEFGFEQSGLLGKRVYSSKMVTIEQISPLVVYEAEKAWLHKGDSCVSVLKEVDGWLLIDNLDVADIVDEKTHDYRFWETEHKPGVVTYALKLPFFSNQELIVADGGRVLTGGEEMVIKTRPSTNMKMIVRHRGKFNVEILVNDKHKKMWKEDRGAENVWTEAILDIPSEWITTERTRISVLTMDKNEYFPAHYWFYQR
ncbi:hypothetical protein AUJ95_05755 [Candidatus Desantisbacteria bacterium CG2_30_40_21]|uniref:Glycosyltransferase RgtA/B/C/D-like domain-containing protein n=2 Tax=unclassified Candidatus Desantisiibacteriota TaxID=3106372 RepID=A0A2M7P3Q2_9BACT|nr:MAG: hypothetical protein AUJ95_05755 [Candidatus Desantisbacteria bacterium CG2_30_40_21]PIY19989.1 MAG: hypothetical protein COZ13_02450 [Candidatus Desantisbacteria bacterium CG_4_10_14_3_um_filter_40_18]